METAVNIVAAGLVIGPWLALIWVSLVGGTIKLSSKGLIPQLEQLIKTFLKK